MSKANERGDGADPGGPPGIELEPSGPPTTGVLPALEPDPERVQRQPDSGEVTSPRPLAPARPETPRPAEKKASLDPVLPPPRPEPEPELQLDLAVVKRPAGGELSGRPGAVTTAVADRSAAASWSQTRVYGTIAPPARGLFGTDPIVTLLFALCIGVAVGMVVALVVSRGVTNEAIVPLEEELAGSLARTADVERGRLRAPAAIQADLDRKLSESQTRFFLVWLGTAIPLGLLLGRFRLDR